MSFPENIMIVEDEKSTQRYLTDILKQYQVSNIEFFDIAEDALARISSKNFDIVLMDINLNGNMNGIELAKKILQIIELPIVFISGERDIETFENVLALSPYGFVQKPFSSREIEFSLQLAYQNYIVQVERCKKREVLLNNSNILIGDRYHYNTGTKRLYEDDLPVKLNLRQEKAIEILCNNINHTVTYEVLSYAIWGESNKNKGSAMRNLIYTIRKLLPDLPLISYSKVGYSLQREII